MTDLKTQQPASGNDTTSGESSKTSPWMLFAIPIGLGLCLSFVVVLIKWLQEENTRLLFVGLDGMRLPIVIGLLCMAAAVLGLYFVRPQRKTVAIAAAILTICGYAFSKVVRIEGYYGNRTPRLTWRWNPTAEQRIRTYLTSTSAAKIPLASPSHFLPSDGDFAGFLGNHRDATINEIDLATDWDLSPPKLLWRHPVGLGWSSFAVVGRVAVNLEQRETEECVVCYDVRTGLELWCNRETARFKNDHGDGPRSTPSIHNGRVLSMGATGQLTCIDLESGELLWKRSAFANPSEQNLLFGMSGSPLVFDDNVLITPGAGDGASAIAYSLATGDEVWRGGSDPAAYASPIEVSLCGQRQLLSFNGAGLRSYDITGKPLWLHPWLTQGESRVNVAQPVVVNSSADDAQSNQAARILISSGYDKGTALLKITRRDDDWISEVVWESKHLKSKLSNFVVYDDHIYGLDNGLLTCIGLENGRRVWKRGRYGHGQLLLVRDKLLIQAETGEVVLVAATPDSHQELTRIGALSSKTWNNLALAGDILVVRNDREAAAFKLPLQ